MLQVTLTGTGMPNSDADRAGPGVLVRAGQTALQFDAGRATVMRLAAVGQSCSTLTAVFLTHHHSDHLLALDDVVLTHWLGGAAALPVVAPEGPAARFARRVVDIWCDDIDVRTAHMERKDRPAVDVRSFDPSPVPKEVWRDKRVVVTAVAVHHEPVTPAVAYRVDAADGSVVISGDTRACDEVEDLARGASILVHEVVRASKLRNEVRGTMLERIHDYHADSIDVGALAERAGVPVLMLTHFIPAPRSDADLAAFVSDVREGGYTGKVLAGPDLTATSLEGASEGSPAGDLNDPQS